MNECTHPSIHAYISVRCVDLQFFLFRLWCGFSCIHFNRSTFPNSELQILSAAADGFTNVDRNTGSMIIRLEHQLAMLRSTLRLLLLHEAACWQT